MDPSPRLRRREFVASAGSAGLALATGAPGLARRAAKRPHHRSDLERVEHIVILMQENRSFDHYYGTLPGVRGFSDPNAIKLPSGRSVFEQPYPLTMEGYLRPWHFDASVSSPCAALVDNGWAARHAAFNDGRMDGFVGATGGLPNYFTMAYYSRADVPWHMALTDEFTVCDGYYCSVLGPTNSNRLMMWTGTIDPHGRDGGPDNDNQAYSNANTAYTWTTYPERLTAAGVSWTVYHSEDDFDDNALKYFKRYQDAKPGSALYENAMRNRPNEAFAQDVAAGRLAQVSWIVAPTAASEHPGYSPGRGADYNNGIVQALFAHPDVWAKTAFVFTYDEDGGYFDHVPPPTPPPGTADEFVDGKPIGLGFRVPTVVCSPWTRGGYVSSTTYDHTSLIRLIERRFGVKEPNISEWRRRTCGDLWDCFDFTSPDFSIPALPQTAAAAASGDARCSSNPPAVPRSQNEPMPAQEQGARGRRPCPKPAASVTVRLPALRWGTPISGTVKVAGKTRALRAHELRRRRVVLNELTPGRHARVQITLRVRGRRRQRTRTLRVTRTIRVAC